MNPLRLAKGVFVFAAAIASVGFFLQWYSNAETSFTAGVWPIFAGLSALLYWET